MVPGGLLEIHKNIFQTYSLHEGYLNGWSKHIPFTRTPKTDGRNHSLPTWLEIGMAQTIVAPQTLFQFKFESHRHFCEGGSLFFNVNLVQLAHRAPLSFHV